MCVWVSTAIGGICAFKCENTSYEPELFPGLIYRMRQPKVCILIFVSGKIVLTGAKTKNQIDQAFQLIWPILQKFKKQYQDRNRNDTMEEEQDNYDEQFDEF